jgi:hypothetical protein
MSIRFGLKIRCDTSYWGSERVLSRVLRSYQSGLTGGKILHAHNNCGGVEGTGTD